MKPPIPEPIAEPKEARPLSGRLEWDEAEQCFELRFCERLGTRLRCECTLNIQYPLPIRVLVVPFLPVTLLFMAAVQLLRPRRCQTRLCVFPWGVCLLTPFAPQRISWSDIKRIVNHRSDLLIMLRPVPGLTDFALARECFADLEESSRLEEMLRSLSQSQGQSWNEVRARFEASQGRAST